MDQCFSLTNPSEIYQNGIGFSAIILLASAVVYWESESAPRFISYLALAVAASTLKIRLPHLQGTITPAFVLVLLAIAQLSLAETVVVAALGGAVQVLWRPARRPMPPSRPGR